MPIKRRKNQALISALSILAILAIDQSSKFLIQLKLRIGESIPLIRNVFHITFVKNTGAAFGLFKNSTIIFIVISVVVVVCISILLLRSIKRTESSPNPIFNAALILIVSGALGNLIDRLRFGYVVDFIDVRIWPVFNIADTAITVGTCLLLFFYISSRPSY